MLNLGRPLFQFKLGRVPVRFFPAFLFNLVFALFYITTPLAIPIVFAAVNLILLVHELGHALMCRLTGCSVWSVDVQFAGGTCDHSEPATEARSILIAWGGVFAQLALLAVWLVLFFSFPGVFFSWIVLGDVLWSTLVYLNLFMIAFNLVPLPGYDGAVAWRFITNAVARRRAVKRYGLSRRAQVPRRVIPFPKRRGPVSREAKEFADKVFEDIEREQNDRTEKKDDTRDDGDKGKRIN